MARQCSARALLRTHHQETAWFALTGLAPFLQSIFTVTARSFRYLLHSMLACILSAVGLTAAALARADPNLEQLDSELEGQEPLFACDGESFTNASRARTSPCCWH